MHRISIAALIVCLAACAASPGPKPARMGDTYVAVARFLTTHPVVAWDGCTDPREDPAGWLVGCSFREFTGGAISKRARWYTISDGQVVRVEGLEAHPIAPSLNGS